MNHLSFEDVFMLIYCFIVVVVLIEYSFGKPLCKFFKTLSGSNETYIEHTISPDYIKKIEIGDRLFYHGFSSGPSFGIIEAVHVDITQQPGIYREHHVFNVRCLSTNVPSTITENQVLSPEKSLKIKIEPSITNAIAELVEL